MGKDFTEAKSFPKEVIWRKKLFILMFLLYLHDIGRNLEETLNFILNKIDWE